MGQQNGPELGTRSPAIRPFRSAMIVAGIYTAISILWILISDQFVARITDVPETLVVLQTWKGFAFVVVTGGLLFGISYRHLVSLAGSLDERERLLQEVHHRVGNNLQLIYGLFSLQTSTNTAPEYTLARLRDQIATIAHANQQLFDTATTKPKAVDSFIRSVATVSLKACNERSRITKLQFEISANRILETWVVTVALIMNELITNACHHAYNSDRNGPILIRLAQSAQEYELRIEDEGHGYPHAIIEGQEYNLGLTLVSVLAKQLSGSFEATNSQRTGGAVATIRWSDR